MDIGDTKPTHKVAPVRKPVDGARDGATAGTLPQRDAAALAGVLESELTPKARQTLLALLGEVEQLHRTLSDAQLKIGHLEKLVDEDPLIPVANRRAFVRELSRMIAFARRYGVAASIVYVDLDNMKHINDAYGHAAGDAALLQVARALVDNVRNTDVVGRLGGDEFGVLLVQADQTRAEHKAAELAAAVAARTLAWDGRSIALTVAYGVQAFSGGETADDVIDAADRAMYFRKNKRRGNGPGVE